VVNAVGGWCHPSHVVKMFREQKQNKHVANKSVKVELLD
jgi:hypothetical protein